jgi:hypothetical protein
MIVSFPCFLIPRLEAHPPDLIPDQSFAELIKPSALVLHVYRPYTIKPPASVHVVREHQGQEGTNMTRSVGILMTHL